MSLRVLLADESDTIKKVFQLALQDFNAEVKAVHSGLDVVDVAKSFSPDILFADVLLQKVNGYKLSQDIKASADISSTPVVLMWSSFMELDQDQYKNSGAIDHLEKPFDADQLRRLIKTHVPSLSEQKLADFLEFPQAAREEAQQPPAHQDASTSPELDETGHEESGSAFNLGTVVADTQVEEIDSEPETSFVAEPPAPASPSAVATEMPSLSLQDTPTETPATNEGGDKPQQEDTWGSQDITQFQLEETTGSSELDLEKFESLNLGTAEDHGAANEDPAMETYLSLDTPQESPTAPPADMEDQIAITSLDQVFEPQQIPSPQDTAATAPPMTAASIAEITPEIEAIVRAHTQEYLKTIVEKNVIESLERLVKNELNRLLDEELNLNRDLDESP